MEINGREIKFMCNVLASIEIANLCPGKSLDNVKALFEGTYEEIAHNNAMFMIALHRGFIEAEKYKDPEYEGKLLTEEELMLLPPKTYLELQDYAYKAFSGDTEREITTEPIKTKGKKTERAKKSS